MTTKTRTLAIRLCAAVLAFAAGATFDTSVGQIGESRLEVARSGGVPVPNETAQVHGTDRPPPGVDLRRRPGLDELRGRRLVHRPHHGRKAGEAGEAAAAPGEVSTTGSYDIACIGDGFSGKRVVAIYARAIDVADRSAEVAPLIRQYAADADFRINRSAAQGGQGRRVRYATRPVQGGCELDVRAVTLSATGDDSFSNTRSELAAQGFKLADRKYLVWVDAALGICGLGQFYRDSTPAPTNRNNGGPMYARVDAPCWGFAETHELLHTLGAVQETAPHSTAGGHCTDENDVMCYSDADGVTMHSACPEAPAQWVDCGLDDYFNASPPTGSYLASNWNVANSGFLEGAPAPPAAAKVVVTMTDAVLAGSTVRADAAVSVPQGRTFSIAWSTTREECSFSTPNAINTSFSCPGTLGGGGQVTASVVDSAGMATSHTRDFTFPVPVSPRPTKLAVATDRTSVTYGDGVTISGHLTDTTTGEGVGGLPVVVYGVTTGSTQWRQLASATTTAAGRLSAVLRPGTTTTYQVVSSSTSTWQGASSALASIEVSPAGSTARDPGVVPPPPTPTSQPVLPPSGVTPLGALDRPRVNSTIRITRVQYNAPGADTRKNRNGEHLRLKNTGRTAVVLTGWTLRSGSGATYTFRPVRLRAGSTLTVFTGRGGPTSTTQFWARTTHVWKNSGTDSARLRDALGRPVDACSWTARARGYTTC